MLVYLKDYLKEQLSVSESNSEKTVLVTQKYLDDLESSARLLEALQAAGVDNWDGYDWAIEGLKDEQ